MTKSGAQRVAFTFVVLTTACGTSSSASSNEPPDGTCVLRGDVWHCGGGYGDAPQCPATRGACDDDGGVCYDCGADGIAGITCSCRQADGGPRQWFCVGAGTACHR